MVKTGGLRCPVHTNDVHFDESGNPVSSNHLFMDGTEIFNFTLEMVPELTNDTLKVNSLKKDDIDLFCISPGK